MVVRRSLIAEEPDPWLCRCGSPAWSSNGKRILFDVTPGNKDYSYSRIKGLELADGHLALTDLGPGNCPQFSPSDDRVVFVLNNGAIPGAEAGVWLMNASGSDRRKLGGYGRPRWSPDGHQFMILSFSDPCEVMLVDDRPGVKSGPLQVADFKFFGVPGWAGPGTIVAVIGEDAADSIALIDVNDPEQAKVKEVLWRAGKGLDVKPYDPAYSPATRRCAFAGKQEGKGSALYVLDHGKADPPRRLENEGFDDILLDLAFSPDGRYLVFRSNRTDRRRTATHHPSADAPALSGITIDGDLKDWPPAIPRYTINNLQSFPPRNGPGGLEHAFLSTSPDLSAAFSVGYDPKEQVIYLAVIVQDDHLIVGHTSPWDTDSVEVYIDGLHSQTKMPWPAETRATDMPVLQYVGLPGKGPVYGEARPAGSERSAEENPSLMFGGDISKTKTRMAFRREGNVTTYEWAIQAFDHYPDKPTRLVPGMKLGFDVTVCDKDTPAQTPQAASDPEADRSAWISWGPSVDLGGFKGLNAPNIGQIVLGRVPAPVP